MKIRGKLVVLQVAIALVPLLAATVTLLLSMRRLGNSLADRARDGLIGEAQDNLQLIVTDYSQILIRDGQILTLLTRVQAQQVEARFAMPIPQDPLVYFAADYDARRVPDMERSGRYVRMGPEGQTMPVPVNYEHQVFYIAPETTDEIDEHIARLSTMTPVYRQLHLANPGLVYWQYTALRSGIHSSYPGHGGYGDDYDPRQRPWYEKARQRGGLVWVEPFIDASTENPILSVAMPVYDPQGQFAGVTAVDVLVESLFSQLRLPTAWEQDANIMLVLPDPQGPPEQARILLEQGRRPIVAQGVSMRVAQLEPALRAPLVEMIEAAAEGRTIVRTMPWRGESALWANGPATRNGLFALAIVPRKVVVNAAELARAEVQAQMSSSFLATVAIAFVTLAAVVVVAVQQSVVITRPIRRLATAARRFAEGDYDARVHLHSGDELEELANTLNMVGPQLMQRQEGREMVDLADDVHRLMQPMQRRRTGQYEVVARVEYCSRVGGDYVDLLETGSDRLEVYAGDVAGSGVEAVALGVAARALVRQQIGRHEDLSSLATEVNNHLLRFGQDSRFLSLFCGRLDGAARELAWLAAGQEGPLIYRASTGQVEENGSSGPVLGVIEDASFESRTVPLEKDDVITIGADGIHRALDETGRQFGRQRLIRLLRRAGELSAEELHAQILGEVRQFCGSSVPSDDISLVVIRIL